MHVESRLTPYGMPDAAAWKSRLTADHNVRRNGQLLNVSPTRGANLRYKIKSTLGWARTSENFMERAPKTLGSELRWRKRTITYGDHKHMGSSYMRTIIQPTRSPMGQSNCGAMGTGEWSMCGVRACCVYETKQIGPRGPVL